jgi:hypothetical protein
MIPLILGRWSPSARRDAEGSEGSAVRRTVLKGSFCLVRETRGKIASSSPKGLRLRSSGIAQTFTFQSDIGRLDNVDMVRSVLVPTSIFHRHG